MYIMPFYNGNIESLYSYVLENFRDQKSNGVYSNLKKDSIGFFGHVKFMEAQVFLYKATGQQKYLDDLRLSLDFCMKHRRENGINNFWDAEFTCDSNWIESNHLGILAYCTYEYWQFSGDARFNQMVVQLMESIPNANKTQGAFIDGYDNKGMNLDDRQYLADNSEILLGWWACFKITGNEVFKHRYEQLAAFMEENFKTVEHQPLHAAWLVGPRHVKYGEGSLEYCDTSHTTYEQFFISRDIMLMDIKNHRERIVNATDWIKAYALFEDGFAGYNETDDKMIGWTAYFAAQAYWAYGISGDNSYYKDAINAVNAVVGLQNTEDGSIIPIIPVKRKINWSELDDACEGLGTIWQLCSFLQGLATIEGLKTSPVSFSKQSTGPSKVMYAQFDEERGNGSIKIRLSGTRTEEEYRLKIYDARKYVIYSNLKEYVEITEKDGGFHIKVKDMDGDLELIIERVRVI